MYKFIILLSFLILIKCELKMVLEFFRHGAREPIFDFWNAKTFKHPGELTSVGMRQHFLLGTQLRKEYIKDSHFLSINYDPDEIYIRSTNYNRTIMSAESQLYGLYPLETGPSIPEGLPQEKTLPPFENIDYPYWKLGEKALPKNFQPIPVHTVDYYFDYLLTPDDPAVCEINNFIATEQKKKKVYQDLILEFQNNTIRTVAEKINISDYKNLDLETIAAINDVFQNDIYANKPLPKDMSEELWKNITFIYTFNRFYTYAGTLESQKFLNSNIFKEIVEQFNSKIEGKNGKKWIMYSSHDSTLGFMYAGLNITGAQCILDLFRNNFTDAINCEGYPYFAANFLIELHSDDFNKNEYFVKFRVNGKYINVCNKNEKKCELAEFKQRLSSYFINDFNEKCHSKTGNSASYKKLSKIALNKK